MTISSTASRVSANGNGVTTVFSFPYKFLADADLKVIEKNITTGVETLKTVTTHYTVTGAGASAGGSVTMLVPPANGTSLIVYRDPSPVNGLDLTDNDRMPAEEVEKQLDRTVMMVQRLRDLNSRTVSLPEGYTGSFDPKLPAILTPGTVLVINEDGDGFEIGPTLDEIINAITTTGDSATDAAASAEAALDSANAADASADSAAASATAAAASATAAANSESTATAAATSAADDAADAASAAAAATAAADSAFWNDIVFLTSADSPRTILASERGKLFAIDCTGGAVTVNLPEISSLDLGTPWIVGIKKTDVSGNAVTINRDGTDLIDGLSSKTISVPNSGTVMVPDVDPTPDSWTACSFGAGGGSAAPEISGSSGAATAVTAAGGVQFNSSTYNNIHFIESNSGAVVVSANPQIAPGLLVGQELLLKFTSDINTLEFDNGNGLDLPAKFISENNRILCLFWDGSVWSEKYRR